MARAGTKRSLLAAAVVGAMAAPLAACGASGSAAGTGSAGGVLKLASAIAGTGAGTVHLDPAKFITYGYEYRYAWPIYGGLLRPTADGTYVPDLAKSATVTSPTTISVELRPGLTFSDGEKLDANAVKAGVQRNLATTNKGAFNPLFFDISSIDVQSATSLTIHLSQPVAGGFLPQLADEGFFIVAPKAAASGTDETAPVGAGPFMFKSEQPGQEITIVKNPRYWDAKSIRLSEVDFVNSDFGPQTVNQFSSGQINGVVGLPAADVSAVKAAGGSAKALFEDSQYLAVNLCKSSGPLADPRVRQALSYATDRSAINTGLLQGQGQPMTALWSSASPWYASGNDTSLFDYNPTKAKSLLAQAGYPKGFSTTIAAAPDGPLSTQAAQVLQSEWAQIGVRLTIVQSTNFYADVLSKHIVQTFVGSSGSAGLSKVTTFFSPQSFADFCGYSNPELNSLVSQAQTQVAGTPAAKSIAAKIQNLVLGNALAIYIALRPYVIATTGGANLPVVTPPNGGAPVADFWAARAGS